MAYAIFNGRHRGNTGSPSPTATISFGANGHITLNKAAMELLQYPHTVCLLWDADSQRIGIIPASIDDQNGYVVQRQDSRSCGQIHARGFAAFVGRELTGQVLNASLDGYILSAAVGKGHIED